MIKKNLYNIFFLVIISIVFTAVSLLISTETQCYHGFGWPVIMRHEFKPSPPCEVPEGFIGGVECVRCDSGSYEFPLEDVAPILNTAFWFIILFVIYLIVRLIRRKGSSDPDHNNSSENLNKE